MSTFNFGIGLQLEGNGEAAVRGFTDALNGLSTSFRSLSENVPNFSQFTAGINTVQQGVAGASTAVQGLFTGMAGEVDLAAGETQVRFDEMYDTITAGTADAGDDIGRFADDIGQINEAFDYAADASIDAFEDLANTGAPQELADESKRAAKEMSQNFIDATFDIVYKLDFLAQRAASTLTSISAIFYGGGEVAIQKDLVQLTAQMGKGAAAGDVMTDAVENLATEFHFGADSVSGLAQSLQRAGIDFMDVAGGLDNLGDAGRETAARMVAVLKMDPAVVAGAIGDINSLGGSLGELANTSTLLGQAAGVPGLVEQLPGAVDFAIRSQIAFAGSVKKSGAEITRNVQSMTAFYTKALGKDAAQAAQLAQGTFNKFAGAIMQNEDVFLGLADSFDPLTNAMLNAGISFEESQEMLQMPQDGIEGQLEFVRKVRAAQDTMDPDVYQRYIREVTRNADEGTQRMLVMDEDKLASAETASKALIDIANKTYQDSTDPAIVAAREQAKTFKDMSEVMRDSVGGNLDRISNQLNNMVNTFQGAFRGDVKSGLEQASDLFGDLIHWIQDFRKENGSLIKEFGPIIGKIVAGAALMGPAIMGIGAAIAPLATAATVTGVLSGVFATVAGFLGPVALGVGAVAAAFGLVAVGGDSATQVLKQINGFLSSGEDAGTKFGQSLGLLVSTGFRAVDGALGGFVSRALGVTDNFANINKTIVDTFAHMPEKLGVLIGKAVKWMRETGMPAFIVAAEPLFAEAKPLIINAGTVIAEAAAEVVGGIMKGMLNKALGDDAAFAEIDAWVAKAKLRILQIRHAVSTISDAQNPLLLDPVSDYGVEARAQFTKDYKEREAGIARQEAVLSGKESAANTAQEIAAQGGQATIDANAASLRTIAEERIAKKAAADAAKAEQIKIARAHMGGSASFQSEAQLEEIGRALQQAEQIKIARARLVGSASFQSEAQLEEIGRALQQHQKAEQIKIARTRLGGAADFHNERQLEEIGRIFQQQLPSAMPDAPPAPGTKADYSKQSDTPTDTTSPAETVAVGSGVVAPKNTNKSSNASEKGSAGIQEVVVRLQVEVGNAATALERALNELSFRQLRTS